MSENPITQFCENRKHPHYAQAAKNWAFLSAAYQGSEEYFKSYLWRFSKEEADDYNRRVSMATRYNFVEDVIEQYVSYIFQKDPQRENETAAMADFNTDVGHGIEINDFMKDVLRSVCQNGACYVCIDKPSALISPKSRAEEKASKIRPYAYIIDPIDVEDFGVENGQFSWIKVKETYRDNADPMASSGKMRKRIRLWTQSEWTLFEEKEQEGRKEWVRVDEGYHGLGIVPIVQVSTSNTLDFTVKPLVQEIAKLDNEITNVNSMLQTILSDQTFSQLVIPFDTLDELLDDSSRADVVSGIQNVGLKLGTRSVIPYLVRDGKPMPPGYISPDASQASLLLETIKQKIYQIYQKAKLLHKLPDGATAASGKSKEQDFKELNAQLSKYADALQKGEEQIAMVVHKWEGVKDTDYYVDYPDNFETEVVSELIANLDRMTVLDMPLTFLAEMKRKIINLSVSKLDDATWEKIDTEITSTSEGLFTAEGGDV